MGVMTTAELLTEQAKYLPIAETWDKQIETDALSGDFAAAFDGLADEAIVAHKAGKTTPSC